MYCAECGKNITSGSLFCSHCGNPVKNINKQQSQNNNKESTEKVKDPTYTENGEGKTDSSPWNLFLVENNKLLEKKTWFRLLKVAHGISIISVVLFSLLIAYLIFDAKSLSMATLTCNDGTTWNAMDPDYTTLELDTYEKCGLCNKRLQNNTYYKCEYNEGSQKLYNSYTVDRTYEKDNSMLAVLGWSSLSLFGGLLLVKITAKTIVYIFGGGSKN